MKILLTISLLLFVNPAHSELAPEGIVYNQKSCALYTAGDECIHYKLPEGWKEIYPVSKCKNNPKKRFCYKLKNKTCQGTAKKCCEYFGFEFVKIKPESIINTQLEDCKDRK